MTPARIEQVRRLAGLSSGQRAMLATNAGASLIELDAIARAAKTGEMEKIVVLTDDQFAADYPSVWKLMGDDDALHQHLGGGL